MYCATADTLPDTLDPPRSDPALLADSHTTLTARMTALLADVPAAAASLSHGLGGAKSWHRPTTLSALLQVLETEGPRARMVAGNTGAGVFKDWPDAPVVVDLRGVDGMRGAVWQTGGRLRLGGACTLDECVAALEDQHAPDHPALHRLSTMLRRIAGAHVQHAATVGGNVTLVKSRGLESDLVTPLLALPTTVEVVGPATPSPWCVVWLWVLCAHDATARCRWRTFWTHSTTRSRSWSPCTWTCRRVRRTPFGRTR